jgi:hypothetical protein
MDRRTGGVQLSAKSVVVAILEVVRFRVRVRSRAHMLKIRFCQRRLVRRQWVMGRTTSSKEKNGDERRQQDQRKVTSLSVGQGEPPACVINSYSQFGKNLFWNHAVTQLSRV